jgi:hypothetical protein
MVLIKLEFGSIDQKILMTEHEYFTCFEYIRILSNSLLSANAATTFGVALALIYIFNARSLSTVCNENVYDIRKMKNNMH